MGEVERRDSLLAAVEHPNGFERLRATVQTLLNEGVSNATLLEDLGQLRLLVAEADEDNVLDVMDLLWGYCARSVRLARQSDID